MLTALAAPGAALAAPGDREAAEVQEVIVTAQRREEKLQAVPAAITALTAETINDLGLKRTNDLGRVSANLEIAEPNGFGNQPLITIRGIGLNDYSTNNAGPNGVYADEIYQSSPGTQMLHLFDLERVEVLKGPQGTLYGRNASGGAINFISRKPTDYVTGEVHAEYSSFNTLNLTGALGGPVAPNLNGRLAFVLNRSEGYVTNLLTGDGENGARNGAIRLQLQWTPTERLSVLANIHGAWVRNNNAVYQHLGTLVPGTQASAEPQSCSLPDTFAGKCVSLFGARSFADPYVGEYTGDRKLTINSNGGSVRGEYDLGPVQLLSLTGWESNDKTQPDNTDSSPARMIKITYGVKARQFSQEFRASHSSDALSWVGGLYYSHENLKQDQPIAIFQDFDLYGAFGVPAGPGAGDGIGFISSAKSEQKTDAYAVFGQATYALTPDLKATLGARYTRETKTFLYRAGTKTQEGGIDRYGPEVAFPGTPYLGRQEAENFSYKAVLNYYFTPDVHAYGSVATGFKSGAFNGSFLNGDDAASLARQLQPVDPEKVTTYELGLKSEWFDRRLTLNLTAFYNDYKDTQLFVIIPFRGADGLTFNLNVLDNAPKAHTEGLEVEATVRPIEGLTLQGNLGLLSAKLDQYVATRAPDAPDYTGNPFSFAPKVTFNGLVQYRRPFAGGTVDLQMTASYKSRQYFDVTKSPLLSQGSYWISNARAGYEFAGGRWDVAVWVRNLTGKRYYGDIFDLRSPFGYIQGIPGQPRWIGAEVNYRF